MTGGAVSQHWPMPTSSLVSVVIPAYNCARFVAEAVQSVLDQDYGNKEIIVVDDGSTDGTLEILRGFGDAIHLIAQKNAGPPVARNNGLHAVRGEYVAFLDADDVWTQGKVAAQVAHLEAYPDVGTVLTNWHVWPAEPDGSYRRPAFFAEPMRDLSLDDRYSGWLYNRLLFDCALLTTTVMMRSSVVRAIGDFDVSMFNGDDYDYWIRASRIAQISRLKGTGALYRIVPGSVSRKPQAKNFEYEVIQKALTRWGLVGPDGTKTETGAMDRRLDNLILSHSYDHLLRGDPKVALDGYRSVLRHQPTNAKLWVKAAQAFFKSGVRPNGIR